MGKAKNGPNISQNAHDLARREKVDVGQIEGTGNGGQVTVTDVKKYIKEQQAGSSAGEEAKPAKTEEVAGDASGAPAAAQETVSPPAPVQAQPPDQPPALAPLPGTPDESVLEDGRKEIERINQTTGAWWCPFCGRSMAHDLETCGGCGAKRDGEEAVRS